QQNDHCGSNSHASHRGKAVVVPIREQAEGLKTEREQKRHEPSYASADQCVDERFAKATLAFHYTECFGRPGKHYGQRFDECVDKTALLPVFPWKANARRSRC